MVQPSSTVGDPSQYVRLSERGCADGAMRLCVRHANEQASGPIGSNSVIRTPDDLCRQFDGVDLESKTGLSALLSTVDDSGWPHLSFLSAGEVLLQAERLALTLWPDAHSTAALDRQRRGVLFGASEGIVYEVRFEVIDVQRPSDAAFAIVLGRNEAVRKHKAPYASVRSLIDFQLLNPQSAIDRWGLQILRMKGALYSLDDTESGGL